MVPLSAGAWSANCLLLGLSTVPTGYLGLFPRQPIFATYGMRGLNAREYSAQVAVSNRPARRWLP